MSWFLGLQGSDHDREDLQGRLRLAETRAEELAENLRAVTSSMEQYRAMAQSLEESLDREKQVQKNPAKTACQHAMSQSKLLTATTKTIKIDKYFCEQLRGKQANLYHIYTSVVIIWH